MNFLRFDKARVFRPRLIDYVGAWLSRLSYSQASALVIAAALAVLTLDYSVMHFELCIATLYVIPISIACWYFGSREGLAVTIFVTVLASIKYPLFSPDPQTWVAIYNGAARATAFFFIATVVLGARRVFAQMHYIAHRDGVTGVLNKAAFNTALDVQIQQARALGCRLLLTFIDLDGFKKVNDEFGHDAGDTVLRVFTEAVEKEFRVTDLIGRLGGDEFGTLTVLARDDDGHLMAKALHRRFSEILGRSGYAVTCSMGAVIVPADIETRRGDLLREADRLMYRAKQGGKNTVQISTAIPLPGANDPNIQSVSPIRPLPCKLAQELSEIGGR